MKQKLLEKKYNEQKVVQYCNYIDKLKTAKDKEGKLKNAWAGYKKEEEWIDYFEKILTLGLALDGEMITIDSTGIKLGYKAYKNLVLMRYPEAIFDIQLVRQGDEFNFTKDNGKVVYTHKIKNPFEENPVVGGYCVLKLRTGEFLELLSRVELEKIRKKATASNVWNEWTNEMYLKSIIRRTCKRHCQDVVIELDKIDNENFDLAKEDVNVFISQDDIETIEKLMETSGADKIAFISKLLKLNSLSELLKSDYNKAIRALNAKIKRNQDVANANT